MQPSPYTRGELATDIPGREIPLGQITERLAYLSSLQRLVGRIRIDQGPRGVGKTSLLRQAERLAQRRNVFTIWVTAGERSGLVGLIAREIDRGTRDMDGRRDLAARLEGLSLSLDVGVPGVASLKASWSPPTRSPEGPPANLRDFEDLLVATHTLVAKHGKTGIALFIDEIQDADIPGLKTLGYGWQDFQRERPDLPAAVFAAGLPSSKSVINDAISPSERFAYKRLGGLPDDAAMVALAQPAHRLGVAWDHDALTAAAAHAKGYPHTVQLIGDYAWEAAGLPDPGSRITMGNVHAAIQQADDDLQELYDSRFSRIENPSEREFVRAMADLGDGPVPRSGIAQGLGQSTYAISDVRQRLLDAGVVETAGRGYLQFTVDGFAGFVREHFGAEQSRAGATTLHNDTLALELRDQRSISLRLDRSGQNERRGTPPTLEGGGSSMQRIGP